MIGIHGLGFDIIYTWIQTQNIINIRLKTWQV